MCMYNYLSTIYLYMYMHTYDSGKCTFSCIVLYYILVFTYMIYNSNVFL